jgi:cyclase
MKWTRRDFAKASVFGATAGLIPRGLDAQQGAPPAAAAPPAGTVPPTFTPLRRNVGIFNNRGGTIGWMANNTGVLVVDTQFADTAPNFLTGLKERTPRQIDVVINTHHHPDHTGGNAVLRAAARQLVAHERSAQNQKNSGGRAGAAPPTLPDVTFPETWSVTIGDETIRARHWGIAHTGGDAAIHFEQAGIVHLGDLLNNRGYPNCDAPAGGSVHGWISVLEKMAPAYPADTLYIYGHAEAGHPFIGTRQDLFYQRDYFTAVVEVAQKALKAGQAREEAIKLPDLPGFTHFGGTKSRLGLVIGIAYDELQKLRN